MSNAIQTRHGVMSIRYPNDYISKQLINTGEYEWYVVQIMAALCKDFANGIVLDVGANIGTISLPIARMFPHLHIHAFEIQPAIIDVLKENIALNNLGNVTLHEFALSEAPGSLEVKQFNYTNEDNIGAFSLNPDVWKHSPGSKGQGEVFTVNVQSLDTLTFEQPIRCIKLDVEGFELNILKGAVETIKKHNYPPIVYELWLYNRWWDENRTLINNFLLELGYMINVYDDTAVATKI